MDDRQQDPTATAPHGVVMSTTDPEGARLHLVGDLDEAAVDRLRALLDDVPLGGAVRLDLSRARVLPIGVLRVLAAAHRRLSGGGGSFVLVDPSPAAARDLRTSGLDRVLVVRATAAEQPAPDAAASSA